MFIHYFCKMEGKTVFNNQKDDFKTIRDILLKLRYDFYYYNISGFPNYYFNPYQLEENILLKLENYNIEIQTVFKFLLLGYAMPLNEVSEDLKTIIIILHKYNIVVNDGLFYKMNNYSLISYSGYFFIVDMPSYYNNCNIHVKDTPVLLLDDVLSELDGSRQRYLLENIHDIQTMITCTGVDDFVENNFQIDRLFQVVEGTVERRN